VAALDINPGMLAVARSLAPVTGASIGWHEGSALALPFADAAFDVALCQLGLQFFPDRPAALSEMRRVLVHDGRLALNVFGPIERNPATHALADALDRHIGAGASAAKRTEHALADTAALGALLARAGFADIVIDTADRMVRFPSASEYVAVQLAATPLATLIADHDGPGPLEALVADVDAALVSYRGSDGLTFPQEVHVVTASA
jgi:SAM-dependent methyltransferase